MAVLRSGGLSLMAPERNGNEPSTMGGGPPIAAAASESPAERLARTFKRTGLALDGVEIVWRTAGLIARP